MQECAPRLTSDCHLSTQLQPGGPYWDPGRTAKPHHAGASNPGALDFAPAWKPRQGLPGVFDRGAGGTGGEQQDARPGNKTHTVIQRQAWGKPPKVSLAKITAVENGLLIHEAAWRALQLVVWELVRMNKHRCPQAASLFSLWITRSTRITFYLHNFSMKLGPSCQQLSFIATISICSVSFLHWLMFRFFPPPHMCARCPTMPLVSPVVEVEAISTSAEQLSFNESAAHKVCVHARHQPEGHWWWVTFCGGITAFKFTAQKQDVLGSPPINQ